MQQSISLKEYYLWPREKTYPWERQYINYDFLKYEQKRIRELSKWFNKFKKAQMNGFLDDAPFYAVPADINSSWKAAIAEYGNLNYIGLSALNNTPAILLIGLIPYSAKKPQDRRLIDITRSKKIYIVNRKENKVQPVLLIEDWNYLRSDSIYADVPYEKHIVHNLISENLINDDQISLSFQAPIISAPFSGSVGGISLSSLHSSSSFAQELAKTIQLMVPPEYRISSPPRSAYKGQYFQYCDGIEFHLAERPHSDSNILSSFYATKYDRLIKELQFRNGFKGEFSVFSAINPPVGNLTQMLKELWKNFTATEITLPEEIDKLPLADVDLTPLRKVINEDLWIQIVYSRQLMPAINADVESVLFKNVSHLREHFDIILSEIDKQEESREFLVNRLISQSRGNLIRIAQSFARAEEKQQLSGDYIKRARDLIIENFDGFYSHPEVSKIKSKVKKIKSKKIENPRYSIIQTEIINNPYSSISEIFEAIKSTNFFKDIYDLQKALDWMHERGYVIVDSNKRYLWVGRYVG